MVPRLLAAQLAHGRKSALVLGPRQTGKSTLIHALSPHLSINLADEVTYLELSAHPAELEARIRRGAPKSVFIDEVQRLPSLLNTVQHLIDSPKLSGVPAPRFLLTGSSARKLRRGQANLLPGRLFIYSLGPLCAAELDYQVDTQLALSVGTLPEPYLEHAPQDKRRLLRSYAGTYLREEIQAEALTRNLESFSRFLDVAAAWAGKSIDFSKLAARAKIARRSAMRYFDILEDTLVARRVEPVPDVEADLVRHPKVYFFDPGVWNGLLGNFTASGDRVGALFEHLWLSQVLASAAARDQTVEVHTFRTRGGLEVDFVVDLEGVRWLVELKATSTTTTSDTDALSRAAGYFPAKTKRLLIHLGNTEKTLNGVPALSWQSALKEMGL